MTPTGWHMHSKSQEHFSHQLHKSKICCTAICLHKLQCCVLSQLSQSIYIKRWEVDKRQWEWEGARTQWVKLAWMFFLLPNHTLLSSTTILFLFNPSPPPALSSSLQLAVLHLPIESIPLCVSHHHFRNPFIQSSTPSSPFLLSKFLHVDLSPSPAPVLFFQSIPPSFCFFSPIVLFYLISIPFTPHTRFPQFV